MNISNLIPANFYLGDSTNEITLKGFYDPSQNFKGISMPYISEKSIADFIYIASDCDWLEFTMCDNGEMIVIDRYTNNEGENRSDVKLIENISIDGERYFNLGCYGLHFQTEAHTLTLNRKRFLDWYFNDANFNGNVYDGLLSDGKYCLDIVELLDCVDTFPANIVENGQLYLADELGNIDASNYNLKIN